MKSKGNVRDVSLFCSYSRQWFFFLSSRWRWWMMIHSMAGSASLFTFVGVRFVPFLFFFLGFRRRQRFVGRRKKIARRKKKKKKKRRKNGVPIHSLAFVELLAPFGSKYFEKLFLFFFFEFGLRRWFGSFFFVRACDVCWARRPFECKCVFVPTPRRTVFFVLLFFYLFFLIFFLTSELFFCFCFCFFSDRRHGKSRWRHSWRLAACTGFYRVFNGVDGKNICGLFPFAWLLLRVLHGFLHSKMCTVFVSGI